MNLSIFIKLDLKKKLAEVSYPLLLVFQFALGYIQLLESLEITYSRTLYRTTRTKIFSVDFNLTIILTILLIFWISYMIWKREWKVVVLAATPIFLLFSYGYELAIASISILSCAVGLWIFKPKRAFLTLLVIMITGLSIIALLQWAVLTPIGLSTPLHGVAMFWLDLFFIHSNLAPLLVLPFLFQWINKHVRISGWESKDRKKRLNKKELNKISKLILLFSLILSLYSSFYPYLPKINPQGRSVGVDETYYVNIISEMERNPFQAFNVSSGSKPLIFLFIIGFKRLFGLSTAYSVRYFPALLNPLLVTSVFLLGYEFTQNSEIAAYAAFFTSTGFPITVGMYSYFLANNLGLTLISLSLGLLFRAIRKKSKRDLAAASILGIMLAYTHPWTLDQYTASLAIITGLYWYRNRITGNNKQTLNMLATYLGTLAISELIKLSMGNFGGIAATTSAVNQFINISKFWYSSIFNFKLLYGGFMSNLLIFALAIIGQRYITLEGVKDDYFRWFLILTSLMYLLTSGTIKSRLLYNIPFGLYASMGLEKASTWIDQRLVKGVTVTYSTAYLFMCLANLI